MSRISGVSRPEWPPLRTSFAGEGRAARQAAAEPVEAARDRGQELAVALEQRLSGTLGQIRSSVFGKPGVEARDGGGRSLDILA